MALSLTRGNESRTAGAPFIPTDMRDEYLRARTRELMAQNPDLDEIDAATQAEAEINEAAVARQQQEQAIAGRYADRQAQRAQAQGVNPNALPFPTSARDIQELNRPLEDAEAAIGQQQDIADRVTRGLREGRRDWQAEGEYQYAEERGLGNPNAGPGQTDLDYRNRVMRRRGQFVTMPDGSVIPVGADPTAQDIENERKWVEWANENPGTERQALYDPAAYGEFREGVRNDIRDQAREDMEAYGTGTDDQLKSRIEAGDQQAAEQYERRQARNASEDRVNNSDWQQRRRQERLAARAGLSPAAAAVQIAEANKARNANMSPEEIFEENLRVRGNLNRLADRQTRRDRVAEQAMLAGGQPTGGPFGTRATTNAINELGPGWREIAILDRLTNGRVGGPTPLGVDAVGAQNAFRMMQGMGLGEGFVTNPAVQHQVQQAQLKQQADVITDAENFVTRNFAYDNSTWAAWLGFSTPFSAGEQQQTVDYLMNKYGPDAGGTLTLAEAQSIVDNIAARRPQERPARAPNDPRAAGPAPPGWPIGQPWPPE